MGKISDKINSLYRRMVGYRTRGNYWSNTAFAKKIRLMGGLTPKPRSATFEEWRQWEKENSSSFAYWLAEDGLDIAQDIVNFVPDVYHNVRAYVRNRFIDKIHYLDTKLPRGQYYEFDTRLIHGVFEEMCRFVETEKAHMQFFGEYISMDEDERKKAPRIRKRVPSREAGLQHLEWEISLGEESPHQSATAKELKELYLWWKDTRPNRPNPMDASGWSEYCDNRREDSDWLGLEEKTEEERAEVRRLLERTNEIEQEQYREDEEMMIRLIKIRRGCWT